MLSQFVFVLKLRIKQAFHLLVHMRFLFLLSIELTLGHLRSHKTDVSSQPNSPPDCVFRTNQSSIGTFLDQKPAVMRVSV